ncbi:MAG: hypothetical protein ACYTFY_05315 [Planctomycetota bacterium]|jgi:hypothetical protein
MASSRRSKRSSRGSGGGKGGKDGGWKKSKPLLYVLVVIIGLFWLKMLFFRGGSSSERVKIPQAFSCAECKELVVFEKLPKGHTPYDCSKCGMGAAWPAFACNECKTEDGKQVIFPNIVELPEGVEAPAPGEEPSMEYLDAMMMAEGMIPKCPKCEKIETVERYLTPEAKKMLQELREKYRKKRKGKKK